MTEVSREARNRQGTSTRKPGHGKAIAADTKQERAQTGNHKRPSLQGRLQLLARAMQPVQWGEIGVFTAVVVFCFFAFQHQDLHHTIGCSQGFLNGHFSDFYEYNAAVYKQLNYLPSTYIIYALWGLPLKLLNLLPTPGSSMQSVQFWYKLLNCLFYAGTAYWLHGIGLRMGLTRARANILAALWASTPIALFSVLIFGQYDVITAFFFMWGLHAYMDGKLLRFTAIVGIALTCKYFPIFLYVPLLLLREKRFPHIVAHCLAVLAPLVLQVYLYFGSPAFQSGVLGFEVAQRAFGASISIGNWQISTLFFLWFSLCAMAYLKEPTDAADSQRWVGFLSLAASCLFFGLVFWHPQWLLFLTPFLAIAAVMHPRSRFFYLVDAFMMGAMVVIVVATWPDHVDQALWKLGIFGGMNPNLSNPAHRVYMARIIYMAAHREVWLGMFEAGLLTYAVAMYPSLQSKSWTALGTQTTRRDVYPLIWRFALGMFFWMVPAATAYIQSKNG